MKTPLRILTIATMFFWAFAVVYHTDRLNLHWVATGVLVGGVLYCALSSVYVFLLMNAVRDDHPDKPILHREEILYYIFNLGFIGVVAVILTLL